MNLDKKEILIKLENVGINQDNKWLVHDVSLEIERGKILTLIGPNGSGKTTTAKIALGIHKNIKGKVTKNTNKIGYVPQKISIDWTLPIRVIDFMSLTQTLQFDEVVSALKLTEVEFISYVFDKTKLNKGASSDLNKVEKEDEFVVQNVQKGINSAFYKSGRYSATKEKGVHHFHYLMSKFLNS